MDHYGIGAGIIRTAHTYLQSRRGTGRTASMIGSLRSGDLVVFTNQLEADRVRRICCDQDIDILTRVVSPREPGRLFDTLRGIRITGRCFFDHSWVEEYYMLALEQCSSDIDKVQQELSAQDQQPIFAKWRE